MDTRGLAVGDRAPSPCDKQLSTACKLDAVPVELSSSQISGPLLHKLQAVVQGGDIDLAVTNSFVTFHVFACTQLAAGLRRILTYDKSARQSVVIAVGFLGLGYSACGHRNISTLARVTAV